MMSGPGASPTARPTVDGNEVLRQYYTEHDIFLSADGILKVVAVMGCMVSSVLYLGGGACGGAPALLAGAAGLALGAAGACALLYAGAALRLPLLAPTAWLYTDIIVSSVAGLLLMLVGVLSVTVCELSSALDYALGPLAMTMAATVTGSAIITYSSAMRHWDSARAAADAARPTRIHRDVEQDV